MLHATTALYTHTVIKEKPVDASTKEKSEDEKASGWYRWRNMALEMYNINYRYSDIVLEERDTNPQDWEQAIAHAYLGYEGLGVLRAGDRAPEAPGLIGADGQGTSLFALFKPTIHTMLVFTIEGQEQLTADITASVARYPKEAVQTLLILGEGSESGAFPSQTELVDQDGHAHNAYFVEKGKVNIVVVRPDGFIGAIVMDASGVQRYFMNIFDAAA